MELATLRFIAQGKNVLLAGMSGTGKSHIALALALLACAANRRVLYTTSADMLARLNTSLADDTLTQALKPYTRGAELLVVDEVSLKQVERNVAPADRGPSNPTSFSGQPAPNRVQSVLQLECLALTRAGDRSGGVTLCHQLRCPIHVAYLHGDVRRHIVDRSDNVVPGAWSEGMPRLRAELALHANLVADTRDLREKQLELLEIPVEAVGEFLRLPTHPRRDRQAEAEVPAMQCIFVRTELIEIDSVASRRNRCRHEDCSFRDPRRSEAELFRGRIDPSTLRSVAMVSRTEIDNRQQRDV